MFRLRPYQLALTTLATLAAPSMAAAGSYCCPCAMPCAPAVQAIEPYDAGTFLIVNQGPVYSGPGIVLVPGYVAVDTMSAQAAYPYVGRDYYYPHYRYGGSYSYPIRHRVHYRNVQRRHVSRRIVRPLESRDR